MLEVLTAASARPGRVVAAPTAETKLPARIYSHNESCLECTPECICNSCVYDSDNEIPCCMEHDFDCFVVKCPDYSAHKSD